MFLTTILISGVTGANRADRTNLTYVLNDLLVHSPGSALRICNNSSLGLHRNCHTLVNTLRHSPDALRHRPLHCTLTVLNLRQRLTGHSSVLSIVNGHLPRVRSRIRRFNPTRRGIVTTYNTLCRSALDALHRHVRIRNSVHGLRRPDGTSGVHTLLLTKVHSTQL